VKCICVNSRPRTPSLLEGFRKMHILLRSVCCTHAKPRYLGCFCTLMTALLFILPATCIQAQDKIEMELTVVKGNKELPKVLYIVPWKRLADGNIQQKLVLHSLFEDAFDPIEPHAFEQYVEDYRYFADSQSK
jgi:hypothetical protein